MVNPSHEAREGRSSARTRLNSISRGWGLAVPSGWIVRAARNAFVSVTVGSTERSGAHSSRHGAGSEPPPATVPTEPLRMPGEQKFSRTFPRTVLQSS